MMRALHRLVLRWAPKPVRESYGDDMAETSQALYDAAAAEGSIAVLRVLVSEISGVITARWSFQSESNDGSRAMFVLLRNLLSFSQLRQAARSLSRRRAFFATAVITLAFGVAATTAVFAVVDTVLLKPLPYPHPDRLVAVFEVMPSQTDKTSLVAPGRLEDWNRLNASFEAIAGIYSENVTDTSGSAPEQLKSRRVTPKYFDVFEAAPLAGRTFVADEERFGGPSAVIISEGFWDRRFRRSPNAVGSRLAIGGVGVTIVGVMPLTFASPTIDAWFPAQVGPGMLRVREARFLSGVGRIKPGVTIDQARQDLANVQRRLGEQYPASDKNRTVSVDDLRQARVGASARTLWLVFGAIAMLWLIGVANMAGLMLVQLHRRAREIAIRTAIGASRAHVVGIVTHEVAVIAVLGGAIGAGLAAWLIAGVPEIFTALPRMAELHLDWRALTFAVATSLGAALVFGVWPVVSASGGRLTATLSRGTRGASSGRHGMQRLLVVAQVALSLLLVASAALLVRSYYNITSVSAGFSTEHVLTFHVGARWDEDRTRVGHLQEQLLAGLKTSPGVEAAGMTNFLPMTGATLRSQVRVDGVAGTEKNGTTPVGTRMISDDYLQTLNVPLLSGGWCPELKTDFNAPGTVLVNQRFVTMFAAGQNIIGRPLHFAQSTGAPYTIAGVVGDVVEDDPQSKPVPYIYTCDSAGSWPDPEYVVRTRDPGSFAGELRSLVHTLDGNRAIFGLVTLDHVTDQMRETPRLNAGMLTMFAGMALLLASIGLYSLFMLLVSERAREIGVRLALGASPRQIVGLVWTGAARLLTVGILLGLAMSVAAENVLRTAVFGVSPLDPMTLGLAVTLLAGVSALAIAIPASRAAKVDPLSAMKSD